MEKNLTTGSVFKNVLVFSLPYLLSYFLQTLYGMADLFIIGQFDGVSSTTAVSIGSQVMHMLTVMIVGLAMGATVSIGQAVGARQKEQAAAYIGNTITLFMGLSVVLTCILLIANRSIVGVMSTPKAAVEGTVAYLTICFLGIPFITPTTSSAPFSGAWGTAKAPCTLSWQPALPTLHWTTSLWEPCTWAPQEQRWEPSVPRQSAWWCPWFLSAGKSPAFP